MVKVASLTYFLRRTPAQNRIVNQTLNYPSIVINPRMAKLDC